jgi:hypothetical protein
VLPLTKSCNYIYNLATPLFLLQNRIPGGFDRLPGQVISRCIINRFLSNKSFVEAESLGARISASRLKAKIKYAQHPRSENKPQRASQHGYSGLHPDALSQEGLVIRLRQAEAATG